MTNRKGKGPGSRAIILLLGMGAMGLAAFGAYVKFTPADKVPAELRRAEGKSSDPLIDRQGTRDGGETSSRHGNGSSVFVPKIDGEKIKMVVARVEGDAKLFVLNKTLEALQNPGRAKAIHVVGGVAKVDLSGAVESGMGSMSEATFLKAIQMSLGQFKDVELIQFTVDGQAVETLGGHIEVVDPIPVIRGAADSSAGATRP